jgi:hypothetical protein
MLLDGLVPVRKEGSDLVKITVEKVEKVEKVICI